jgi:hypothetical protein
MKYARYQLMYLDNMYRPTSWIVVFWFMRLSSLVSEEPVSPMLRVEDRGVFLRNIVNHLQDDTVPQYTRPRLKFPPQ